MKFIINSKVTHMQEYKFNITKSPQVDSFFKEEFSRREVLAI